jgi:hypothetical protein
VIENHGNMFLRDEMDFTNITSELKDKGEEEPRVIGSLRRELTSKPSYDLHAVDNENRGIHGRLEVEVESDSEHVVLCAGGFGINISAKDYTRLVQLYAKAGIGWYDYIHKYVFITAVSYNLLDHNGLQWAVPPAVLNIFKNQLGCDCEIFASPFNHRSSKYYSLFYHDRYFNSSGNFFTAPDSDFATGCYHVNPPFIISVFNKTVDRLEKLLTIADCKSKELTFIIILPDWKDATALDRLKNGSWSLDSIYCSKYRHYYMDYSDETYIKATFGTWIFFLSTAKSLEVPYGDIIKAFSSVVESR